MKTSIRALGNSQGVLIPKPILAQVGMPEQVEMSVEDNAIVLRPAGRKVREGWTEACRRLAAAGDDAPVWPEFANADDDALQW